MSRVLIIILACCFVQHDCAKILAFFPAPSISHQAPFRPITQELARRGHQVTVVTTDPVFPKGGAPANLTEIDIHDISYAFKDNIFAISGSAPVNQFEMIHSLMHHILNTQLKDETVKSAIHPKNNYDLLILEACFRNALALTHVFKVPVILISSFGTLAQVNNLVGSAEHPILYPISLYQRVVHGHSVWDKLRSFYTEYISQGIISKYEDMDNKMLKEHFGQDLPSLKDLSNNVDMVFLNVHPIWENNRPVPPNVIYLGGLPQKPDKELPKDLKSFLDSSKNGVIYISFGTNVNSALLPRERIQVFQNVLSQLPFDVIWKWDKDEMEGKPANVRISKWLPQSDLLKHPQIRLFITQGGLQSTDEALAGGVPLLAIPMLGDQWYNADLYVKHKLGKKLELEDIDEETLKATINDIIKDPSYRKNVKDLHSTMFNQPETALERAIFWTEFVLKHGGAKQLRAEGANLTWREYYELDLLAVCIISVTTFVYSTVSVILKCCNVSKVKKIKKH